MKFISRLTILLALPAIVFLTSCSSLPCCHKGTLNLLRPGSEGWEHALADNSVSRDTVWSREHGYLKCTGTPIGVLTRGPEVTDFRLVVEYRWAPGTTPGNSGIFSRIEEPLAALPKAIEVQLQHGKAGDVMGLKGKRIAPGQERYFEVKAHPVAGDISGVAKITDAERAPGKWNRVVIEARGDHYTVHMNGKLVNDVHGVDVSRGKVGLQSEGGEIHFRKFSLKPL